MGIVEEPSIPLYTSRKSTGTAVLQSLAELELKQLSYNYGLRAVTLGTWDGSELDATSCEGENKEDNARDFLHYILSVSSMYISPAATHEL